MKGISRQNFEFHNCIFLILGTVDRSFHTLRLIAFFFQYNTLHILLLRKTYFVIISCVVY